MANCQPGACRIAISRRTCPQQPHHWPSTRACNLSREQAQADAHTKQFCWEGMHQCVQGWYACTSSSMDCRVWHQAPGMSSDALALEETMSQQPCRSYLLVVRGRARLEGGLERVAQQALQVVHPRDLPTREVHPYAALAPPRAEVAAQLGEDLRQINRSSMSDMHQVCYPGPFPFRPDLPLPQNGVCCDLHWPTMRLSPLQKLLSQLPRGSSPDQKAGALDMWHLSPLKQPTLPGPLDRGSMVEGLT